MRYLMNYDRDPMLDSFEGLFDDMMHMGFGSSAKVPAVDIREEDKQYVVEAELAGYGEGDVEVNVDKHVLHIASKKEENKDVKNDNKDQKKDGRKYLVRERMHTSFERAFSLPEDVNEAGISASFKNGVLTVVLPKKEVAQPKKIQIAIGSGNN